MMFRFPTLMADIKDKWADNIVGKFYVDQQCIDCDLCRETAPDFFKRSDDGGYSYVYKQPEAQEDIDKCMEALEGCPVEAIGHDGDTA
jgi:ferredoxin